MAHFWRRLWAKIGNVNFLPCSILLYVFVALLWFIPDPRIEREIEKREE